jgi:hypothetical protein
MLSAAQLPCHQLGKTSIAVKSSAGVYNTAASASSMMVCVLLAHYSSMNYPTIVAASVPVLRFPVMSAAGSPLVHELAVGPVVVGQLALPILPPGTTQTSTAQQA